ncbi:hypothetical protein [Serratia marcescens]|nr:hypothetical protein [Serratia marcescens]
MRRQPQNQTPFPTAISHNLTVVHSNQRTFYLLMKTDSYRCR